MTNLSNTQSQVLPHEHEISDINGLGTSLSGKQDKLVAGSNISIAADGKTISATDTKYTAGTNVQIDVNNKISATDTKYDPATQSVAGLMSAADKTKLDGIAEGAGVQLLTGVKGNAESSYRTGNVNITKANIGLGNVDNTSDANKPVSTATQSALDLKQNIADMPTDLGDFTNNAGFIKNTVNDLTNYYKKTETYTQTEIDTLISNFGGFEVVATLPTSNIKTNVIYLLGPIGTGADKYEEWIYYSSTWTKIGETSVDLTNYAQKSDVLTKTNTTSFTPTANYHPATKKYVDDTASGKVSDTAYASSWNGVTTIAPSKNAVYDKISAMDTTIGNKANDSDVLKKTSSSMQTCSVSGSGATTALALTSNTDTSYIALNGSNGFLGSYGVTSDKNPTFYNGNSYQLAYTTDIPSAMTASELNTGTSTTGRTISAALLKTGITGAISARIDTRDYSSSWDGSTNAPTQNAVYDKISAMDTTISGKQNALSTQTAYTSKGTATKVPQITTNNLGQVTGITEVDIEAGGTYTAGKGIEIKNGPDYSAMQGPAPDGFHVPLTTEWEGLKTIMNSLSLTTGDGWRINLHMPFAGRRDYSTAGLSDQGSDGYYWSSSPYGSDYPNYARGLRLNSSNVYANNYYYLAYGLSVRCFKDSYVAPDSSWTVVQGTLGSAGIFWNQTDGLISITSNGTTGYTIQDKNLGATTVYSDGDTLTQANMGNMYQWGNNYGFPSTGSVTTSSTQVDASTYGPGNYYNSDTFITGSKDWSNVHNDNLRGGVTGVVTLDNAITNTGVLSVNGQTGSVNLYSAITVTLTSSGWSSNTQTVTATGVTASNNVVISPAPSSFADYASAVIYCSAQASNSLTFTCKDTPTSNLTVNVLIMN